jgi:adenylate cyclase
MAKGPFHSYSHNKESAGGGYTDTWNPDGAVYFAFQVEIQAISMKHNFRTIAVLPFVNMSTSEEHAYFSDGITEEIINALAGIDKLKVVSRTSSFYFKDKNIPIRDIARQLNVATILEGSVRRAGDTVRITAQLIEAEEDFHFWSETWDRKFENIFDIQDEISLAIADKLREHIGHFEIADHLVTPQTDSLEVYQLALKARYHLNKWNPDDIRIAIDLWEKAIRLDPMHTESWVGLADAYGFMATTEFMPRGEAWQKAADCTAKAFQLNPNDAGVHYQLANLAFFTECDFGKSVEHAFRSIELRPNYPEAQQFMAFLFILSGNMEKGNKHLQLALDIDPLNQETLFYKAYYLYRTFQFQDALRQLNELLERNPKNIPAIVVKAYCLLMLKRFPQVLDLLDQIPEQLVIPDENLGLRCLTHALNNNRELSDKYLQELEIAAKGPMAFQAHSYLFLAYTNLNRFDDAFQCLEDSLEKNSSIFLLSFTDPLAHTLKVDPRYAQFHQRLYPTISLPGDGATEQAGLLDPSESQTFSQNLEKLMVEEQPYLNPKLNLRLLAAMLRLHPNQLSWLLNTRFEKNFNSFVNDYRVAHFKQLARDPGNSHISLIGLAYESGFNSKTVFNTYFKKAEGLTPGAYLKSITQ